VRLEPDEGGVDTATDGLGFLPIIVGLPIHLTSKRSVDFQIAPLLSYVHYGDLAYTLDGESADFDPFFGGIGARYRF
jgi:hypothetical protein